MEPAATSAAAYSARLAAEIRACLSRTGKSQTDLAVAIGLSRTTLGNKLAGRTEFTVGELDSIARQFGLTVAELLYRAEVAA